MWQCAQLSAVPVIEDRLIRHPTWAAPRSQACSKTRWPQIPGPSHGDTFSTDMAR